MEEKNNWARIVNQRKYLEEVRDPKNAEVLLELIQGHLRRFSDSKKRRQAEIIYMLILLVGDRSMYCRMLNEIITSPGGRVLDTFLVNAMRKVYNAYDDRL